MQPSAIRAHHSGAEPRPVGAQTHQHRQHPHIQLSMPRTCHKHGFANSEKHSYRLAKAFALKKTILFCLECTTAVLIRLQVFSICHMSQNNLLSSRRDVQAFFNTVCLFLNRHICAAWLPSYLLSRAADVDVRQFENRCMKTSTSG